MPLVGAFFAFAIWVGFGVLALFDMAKSNKNKLTEYPPVYGHSDGELLYYRIDRI